MNIEWFIYLANMESSLETALLIIAMFWGTASFINLVTVDCSYDKTDTDRVEAKKSFTNTSKWCAGILIFAALIPSERTLYMIAGAHYGKEAMQSEAAQKVAKLLNSKLDEELAKLGESK